VASLPNLRLSDLEMLRILSFIETSDGGTSLFCDYLAIFAELSQRNALLHLADKQEILSKFESAIRSKCDKVGSAAYGLGIFYFIGFFGDGRDDKAFALFRAAAFAKFTGAEVFLAVCSYYGIGCPQSEENGVMHLTQALEAQVGLKVANNFLTAGDRRPFAIFRKLGDDPQAQFVSYKFMNRLDCTDCTGVTADELLLASARSGFAPALKEKKRRGI
jgi:hypothetical protein